MEFDIKSYFKDWAEIEDGQYSAYSTVIRYGREIALEFGLYKEPPENTEHAGMYTLMVWHKDKLLLSKQVLDANRNEV